MSGSYFFGIDGGGTHSRLALTDIEGNIITRCQAGSTNVFSVSSEEVFKNISLLLNSAVETSGIQKHNLTAGCIGSAGLSRENEYKLFREFFDKFLGTDFKVKLCSDAEILLCGGLDKLEGYCLIAGTGSIALGRSREKGMVRSGGFGYLLGDEGSAAWIAKTAISRILKSLEYRDLPTNMLDSMLKAAGLTKYDDFIRYVHHDADKAKIAALAPVVYDYAKKKDPLALEILCIGAEELANMVRSVVTQSPWILNRELVLAGGVIEHNEFITEKLKDKLAKLLPDLAVFSPKKTALEGACMLAINHYKS